MSKKEAIAEAKKLQDLEIEHKKMTEEEEYRNAGISKEDAQGRGELDLERQIAELKNRVTQLTGIEKLHKDLNGMLRQENYDLKVKVNGQVKLENQINGQKQIIEELSRDNQRLSAEIDDKVKKLRNSGGL
tara:strand:+ start:998 stop:1390 length:393 start_codon:yes stop_codon:yes gene_type:complete